MLRLYHELSCRITADPDPIDLVSSLFCKLCTAEKEEDRYCEWLRGLNAVGSEYQHQFKGSKGVCDSLAMLINGRSGIWSSLWTLRKKKKRSQVFCLVVKHWTRPVKVTEPSPLGFQQRFKSVEPLMKSRLGSTFLKVKCLINADTADLNS